MSFHESQSREAPAARPPGEKKHAKRWTWVVCGVGVAVLAAALARRPNEAVAFRILDGETRKPIPHVYVRLVERWTRLPIDRLNFPGLNSRRRTLKICDSGSIAITPSTKDFVVEFTARGYKSVSFRRGRPFDSIGYEKESTWCLEFARGTKEILIELDREADLDSSPSVPVLKMYTEEELRKLIAVGTSAAEVTNTFGPPKTWAPIDRNATLLVYTFSFGSPNPSRVAAFSVIITNGRIAKLRILADNF